MEGTRRRDRTVAGIAAALAAAAGGVHLALVEEHLREAPRLGMLFAADGVALVAAGAWLASTRSTRAWRLAAWTSWLTVLAYVGSRTLGLPGLTPEPWDLLGLASTAVEAAVVIAGMSVLRRRVREPGARPARRAAIAVAAAVLALAGTAYGLEPPLGGPAHGHDGGIEEPTDEGGYLVDEDSGAGLLGDVIEPGSTPADDEHG